MLLQKIIPGQETIQYLNSCVELYKAAFEGNWKEAKPTFDRYPDIVRHHITEGEDTALHIAAAAKHPNFVKKLLQLMDGSDLIKCINICEQTALHFAAASGIVKIAKEMVGKKDKDNLTLIRNNNEMTPLYIAALLGHREMVSYLFGVTPFKDLSRHERIELLVATISNDFYGMFHFSIIVSLSQLILIGMNHI